VSALAAFGVGVASLAISTAPAKAFQTTVDFSASPSVSNQTTRSFTDSDGIGVQATFSNAESRLTGLDKTIDNNSNGICIARSTILPPISTCGRSSLLPNTNGLLSQGTVDLVFNQQLNLQGFRVGQNSMNQIILNIPNVSDQGNLIFRLNGTEFARFDYDNIPVAGGTLYKFPSSVYYKVGDTVTIENTGFSALNRTFYLKSMDVGYTPAPLPVLATATAFGWSRRLRRRVRIAKAVVQ